MADIVTSLSSFPLAVQMSFWTNVCLFIGKAIAVYTSGSMAVLASCIDSLLDLISGYVAITDPTCCYASINGYRL